MKSQFPTGWKWLVDEAIPAWVKENYSQKESWKAKPFSRDDARFYFKGIQELSELFTEERPRDIPPYFRHQKFRSSYLLYFLPLQAAKFVTLFDLHPEALEATIKHGQKSGTLRLLDLGAGPGTASLAFLLKFADWAKAHPKAELPRIELQWFDTNAAIMEDGKALVARLERHFPRLDGRITVHTHTQPWWKAGDLVREEASLVILGHVLNEAPGLLTRTEGVNPPLLALQSLLAKAHGGGVLAVEPALKGSSQLLSQLRDRFLDAEWVKTAPESIWGPCLHAGRCPLAQGRDWCHFSVPVEIPGDWFREFSRGLGSERQWVKFSYLWLASRATPAKVQASHMRRVVSDPLREKSGSSSVLLCEPEKTGRMKVSPARPVRRGQMISTQAVVKEDSAKKKRSGWPPFGSQRREGRIKKSR